MNELINLYLKRGFGSMTKNDFEVFIFSQLLQEGWRTKSDYCISIELKIPISKVKRLRYEAQLQYGTNDENYYKRLLQSALSKARLIKEGTIIRFSIEDVSLRRFIDATLKEDGRFSDSSFNTEIVLLQVSDYEHLLKRLWPNEYNKIMSKVKQKKQSTLADLLNKFSTKCVEAIATNVGNLAIDGLTGLIKTITI